MASLCFKGLWARLSTINEYSEEAFMGWGFVFGDSARRRDVKGVTSDGHGGKIQSTR